MKVVKLSHPKNWLEHGHWPYQFHFPRQATTWGDYYFDVNNDSKECDIWVVHESIDKKEKVKCAPENIFLITSEEKQQVSSYSKDYLEQFGAVITSRDDIEHHHVIRTFYLSPWRVKKTYDEILSSIPGKEQDFSAIISNNVSTVGHLKRYAFVNKLKGHFKDKLIWFGKGEKEIQDKWEALKSFKYSLALENCSVPFYFTEKIMDCFCASTMPIYWGCPEIADYFPEKSMIIIDIDDYKKSILEIEKAIDGSAYEENFNSIVEARDLVLNKYQFIPALVNILESLDISCQYKKQVLKLVPKEAFQKQPAAKTIVKYIRKSLAG